MERGGDGGEGRRWWRGEEMVERGGGGERGAGGKGRKWRGEEVVERGGDVGEGRRWWI